MKRQAEFFGGSDYLNRMDMLLTAFNEANLLDNVEYMHEIIKSYHDELYCKLDTEGVKKHNQLREEADLLFEKYIVERQRNQARTLPRFNSMNNQRKIKVTDKKSLKNKLSAWRRELQATADSHGLVMADKDDPGSALMNDRGF